MYKPDVQGASAQTLRIRPSSRATTLVVHSRAAAVRFRILSTHATTSLTEMPVSLLPRHRTCQKATDCNGGETSHRH